MARQVRTSLPRSRRKPDAAVPGRLTSPDRLLWPDDGITKRMLAEYFRAMAPRLLRFVSGRPLSLVRMPAGLGGPRFFQRHRSSGMSAAIEEIRGAGDARAYLTVHGADSLVALAQVAAVELHPWGSAADSIERPEIVTLDFDPGEDVGFAELQRAALAVRERLACLGLAAYAKLTGGKGVHLVVPLRRGASWNEAAAFAKRFAEAVAADAPGRFTTDMRKVGRRGRIFLDWLRNERGNSAIAPWSPRAKPGAPLSLPIAWDYFAACRALPVFGLRDADAAVAASDEWAGFDADRRDLPAL